MDVYQRTATGWQPAQTSITTLIGSAGWRRKPKRISERVYGLDSAFWLHLNLGGEVPICKSDPIAISDDNSPTFNSMQVVKKSSAWLATDSENAYRHRTSIRS